MLANLLILGFILSLDNFRTAVALGPLGLRQGQAALVALMFGVCDGVAPLVGVLAGRQASQAIELIAGYLGPILLGTYGLYLLVRALRSARPEELTHSWMIFGLPLPLSLDNVMAGASLGLLGFSPWLAASVFGAITALMAFAGLRLGRAASRLIRIRSDLLGGSATVIMALVLAVFDS
ncbi:manganese efflux pump [Micromonospora sp. B11E3]|uniref:manganese efflux pump MntP n=1 Tax=Micromonospora sp. B11E3 TaxID=3153562 RepID=UPI00325F1BDB